MQDVDFLPVKYRQKRVRRQSQPLRVVVVAVFGVLLAVAAFDQQGRKREADTELAKIMPRYDLAVGQNRRLAGLHTRLAPARDAAELFTYLRHPWPRTQLLAALLAPLPEGITLDRLQITRQSPQRQLRPERRRRTENEAQDDDLQKLPAAARDLKRLRDEFDKTPTLVLISGTTGESAAVHGYLGALTGSYLFSKAELDSLESAEDGRAGVLEFSATLTVRPGYGQPGGPDGPGGRAGPKKNAVARADQPERKEG